MKYIIVFIYAASMMLYLASCQHRVKYVGEGEDKYVDGRDCKYQVGDIVYLKPDSNKLSISSADDCTWVPHYYTGTYVDKLGERHYQSMIEDINIFGKVR